MNTNKKNKIKRKGFMVHVKAYKIYKIQVYKIITTDNYKVYNRLIHFVECSNVHNSDRDSNTAQSNSFVEQRKGFK